MKALLIFSGLIIISLSTMSNPVPINSTKLVNNESMRDLSRDEGFVKTVREVYAIQTRILETNSAGLIKQAAIGTLTSEEQKMLAKNLGYTDYAALNESFNNLGSSILALKNKYTELNDQAISSSVISGAVVKLIEEGKITLQKNTHTGACLSQLFCAIINCIKTSWNCTALQACLCAAYVAYTTCSQNR